MTTNDLPGSKEAQLLVDVLRAKTKGRYRVGRWTSAITSLPVVSLTAEGLADGPMIAKATFERVSWGLGVRVGEVTFRADSRPKICAALISDADRRMAAAKKAIVDAAAEQDRRSTLHDIVSEVGEVPGQVWATPEAFCVRVDLRTEDEARKVLKVLAEIKQARTKNLIDR